MSTFKKGKRLVCLFSLLMDQGIYTSMYLDNGKPYNYLLIISQLGWPEPKFWSLVCLTLFLSLLLFRQKLMGFSQVDPASIAVWHPMVLIPRHMRYTFLDNWNRNQASPFYNSSWDTNILPPWAVELTVSYWVMSHYQDFHFFFSIYCNCLGLQGNKEVTIF